MEGDIGVCGVWSPLGTGAAPFTNTNRCFNPTHRILVNGIDRPILFPSHYSHRNSIRITNSARLAYSLTAATTNRRQRAPLWFTTMKLVDAWHTHWANTRPLDHQPHIAYMCTTRCVCNSQLSWQPASNTFQLVVSPFRFAVRANAKCVSVYSIYINKCAYVCAKRVCNDLPTQTNQPNQSSSKNTHTNTTLIYIQQKIAYASRDSDYPIHTDRHFFSRTLNATIYAKKKKSVQFSPSVQCSSS